MGVWLGAALVVAVPAPAPRPLAAQTPDSAVGRLSAPGAVQMRERVSGRDNDALVKAIERKLRCTCGCNLDIFTCRTTDFTCATSPAMHRLVLARLDSSMTAEQVVAAFQAQYGEVVLMAPPRRGFNWAAYLMPFVALGAGLAILGLALRRLARSRGTPPEPDPVAGAAGASAEELGRLRRELERFEA